MDEKQKSLIKRIPFTVSAFDVIIGLFWFAFFFLLFPLPNNGTATVLKSAGIILWVAVLFIYLGLLLRKSKKSLFLSGLKNNLIVLLLLVSMIISTILAIYPPDALWGPDFNMSNSMFVLFTGVLAFYLIKFLSVSAEKDLTKIFKAMPLWLLISDIASVVLSLIPETTYKSLFGNFSDYVLFFRNSPFTLHGSAVNSLVYHILAITVLGWQISNIFIAKQTKEKTTELIAYGLLLFVISAFAGATLPVSGDIIVGLVITAIVFLLFWGFIAFKDKLRKTQIFVGSLLVAFIVMVIMRILFTQLHVTDTNVFLSLPLTASLDIIQSSFMNVKSPIWRLLTGWGGSAFTYLYPLYRPLSIVQQYGSDVIFYKSSNFWIDIIIEQGFIGLLLWLALTVNAIRAFFVAQKRENLYFEFSLFSILFLFSLISFLPSLVLFLMFVVLASYFDKVENQQDTLKEIRVVSLHVTDYKSNVSNVLVNVVLAASTVFMVCVVYLLMQGGLIHYYLLRTSKRINIAQTYLNQSDYVNASKTLVDAYSLALNGNSFCQSCPTFSYLKLNTLYSLSVVATNYPDKISSLNIDKRFLTNRLINHAYSLVDQNPVRYDYWVLSANVFGLLSDSQNSAGFADEALLSYTAGLNLNPYNVLARYDFVDFLSKLGDDSQSIQLIGQNLDILKQIVGNVLKVKLIEAGYNVKQKQYDNAIKVYNEIKNALDQSTLAQTDKDSIVKFINEQIDTVNKLKDKATTSSSSTNTTTKPTTTPAITTKN